MPDPVYGAGKKLIGKNYQTADLYAKVTGKAKYAEDFRAAGMLFVSVRWNPSREIGVRASPAGPRRVTWLAASGRGAETAGCRERRWGRALAGA